jgi:ankyrin repeat protein
LIDVNHSELVTYHINYCIKLFFTFKIIIGKIVTYINYYWYNMAIKLITSQAYVDSIRAFLPEKPNSKTSASQKADKLFNKIINSPNFIFDKSDKRITDYIATLVTIRPGRTLFKRLLQANKPLTIVLDLIKETCFVSAISTINLCSLRVSHSYSVNQDGEKLLSPTPIFIEFAHELIHVLHFFTNAREFDMKTENKDILDPDFDDLEEQETIIGKMECGTLCDNVFRFHFGYPLRINHKGSWLDKDATFTVIDYIKRGALANLKELLLSNPTLLNLSHSTSSDKSLTLLNASIAENQVEISDYLFQLGVDINAKDNTIGTALHAAVQYQRPDLVKVLLEKGAATDMKNPQGFTALEYAALIKNDEMIALLAPFSNLKEIDKEGMSILHRAVFEGSSERFRALIRLGADINCKDLEGNTPLMYCFVSNFFERHNYQINEKIKILFENDHLNLNAKNNDSWSALSFAIESAPRWDVETLVKKGAEIPPGLEEKVKQCIPLTS